MKTLEENEIKKSAAVNYEILDHVYRENTKKYIPIEKFDRGSCNIRQKQNTTPISAKSSFKMLPEMFTPQGAKQNGEEIHTS